MGFRVNAALNQFNNGLVSPEIEARTDIQTAAYSCRHLTNAYARVAGGVVRAGGSVKVDLSEIEVKTGYWEEWATWNTNTTGDLVVSGFLNGKYILQRSGYENTSTYYISTNLKDLKTCTAPGALGHVIIDGERFISSYGYVSYDGETWEKVFNGYPCYMAFNNGVYFCRLNISPVSWYKSTDLTNWTLLNGLPEDIMLHGDLLALNGKIIATNEHQHNNTGCYASDDNGETWRRVVYSFDFGEASGTLSLGDAFLKWAFGNGVYITTLNGTVCYSDDLTNWHAADTDIMEHSISGASEAPTAVFCGDKFFIVRGNRVQSSQDGANWENEYILQYNSMPALSASNKYVFIGESKKIIYKNYVSEDETNIGSKSILVPFMVSRNISYMLEFGEKYIRFFRNHKEITADNQAVYKIITDYLTSDLWDENGEPLLRFTQSADVMYLFLPNKKAKKLTRKADNDWNLSDADFKLGPWEDLNTDENKTLVINNGFLQSSGFSLSDLLGAVIRIYQSPSVENTYWEAGISVTNGKEYKSDGKFYTTNTSGTSGNQKPTHTEGYESDGKLVWEYRHSGYGSIRITDIKNANQASYEIVEGKYLPKSIYNTPSFKWQKTILSEPGVYPSCGCFFKERLCLGINAKTGPVIGFSGTGDYENFDDLSFGEQLADCGMKLPILSDLAEIQWLSAVDSLYVGTSGGITEIRPQTSAEVFGPENITYDTATKIGTANLQPILMGGSELYVGPGARSIYDLMYVNDNQAYQPQEISLMASKWLEKGVRNWALQYTPNRIIWMVTKDGKLLGLTYNLDQQVQAFHLHETDGEFVSVAAIPSPDGQTDELWACVRRVLNGQNAYCIEYFRDGLPVSVPADYSEEERQSYFLKYSYYVHCGKQFTFEEPVAQVSGLDWLEGREVAVLADGAVVRGKTVKNGQITLPKPATVVTVGIPYKTTFEPLPVYVEGANGTGNARTQRINKIVLRLLNSGGFWYGEDKNNMDYISLRKAGENELAIPLKSGDLLLNWNGTATHNDILGREIPNSTGARMIFEQKDPLPLHILAVYPQLEISND